MNNGQPLVSIVMPTYNRAAMIGETIAACRQQTFGDFELIVVDDGSTDSTATLLRQFDEPRLRLITQSNKGPAAARNRGVAAATGKFIAFLDSDDRWLPDYLAITVRALEASHEADTCVYSRLIVDRGVGRYWIKPDRAIKPRESMHEYLYVHGGFIQSSTIALPTSVARQVPWNEQVTFGDNDQFAIDLWNSGAKFVMLPQAMTRYADMPRHDALSQLPIHDADSSRYKNFFDWMETQRNVMSRQAWCAFQARFASVALARHEPLRSTAMVLRAWRLGALGTTGVCRQLLQNFTPRVYRRLTDQFVRLRGLTWEQVETTTRSGCAPP